MKTFTLDEIKMHTLDSFRSMSLSEFNADVYRDYVWAYDELLNRLETDYKAETDTIDAAE